MIYNASVGHLDIAVIRTLLFAEWLSPASTWPGSRRDSTGLQTGTTKLSNIRIRNGKSPFFTTNKSNAIFTKQCRFYFETNSIVFLWTNIKRDECNAVYNKVDYWEGSKRIKNMHTNTLSWRIKCIRKTRLISFTNINNKNHFVCLD